MSRIRELTQDQWGLVTRRQLTIAGVGPTTVERLTVNGGALERVARGVYRLAGSPEPDHLDLRAAWLQLEPEIHAWDRTAGQGVVSHRSSASMYGLGHLPADTHEFTLPYRKQTRRPDVRIHIRSLADTEWSIVRGLPVSRPARTAADFIQDQEDPESVGQLIAEALRQVSDYPAAFADALAPHASSLGFRRGDGLGVLRWFLEIAAAPERNRWLEEAQVDAQRAS